MHKEPTIDRHASFRNAMGNSGMEGERNNKTYLYSKASVVDLDNKQVKSDITELGTNDRHNCSNGTQSAFDAIKSCITRNHSSNSTSSDVSLLSAHSVTSSSPLTLRILWLTIFLVFVMLILTFVCVFRQLQLIKIKYRTLNEKSDNYLTGFCVPCDDVILGPFAEDNKEMQLLDRKIIDGVDVCCAKTANQTIMLAKLIIEKNRRMTNAENILHIEEQTRVNVSSVPTGHVKEPSVAALLLVGLQLPPKSDESPSPVTNLQSFDPTTYVQGLQVTNDTITVDSSGLYFVYSQIYFSNVYSRHSNSNTTQTLHHYVYRYNVIYPNGGSELLLKSVRTQCWSKERVYGDYTSYMAAAFQLRASDRLYVMVSDSSVVSRDSKASFFGLFKLS